MKISEQSGVRQYQVDTIIWADTTSQCGDGLVFINGSCGHWTLKSAYTSAQARLMWVFIGCICQMLFIRAREKKIILTQCWKTHPSKSVRLYRLRNFISVDLSDAKPFHALYVTPPSALLARCVPGVTYSPFRFAYVQSPNHHPPRSLLAQPVFPWSKVEKLKSLLYDIPLPESPVNSVKQNQSRATPKLTKVRTLNL